MSNFSVVILFVKLFLSVSRSAKELTKLVWPIVESSPRLKFSSLNSSPCCLLEFTSAQHFNVLTGTEQEWESW